MQKNQEPNFDDDFEKLLQEYLDEDLNEDDEADEPESEAVEGELPFPREMDDWMAEIKMKLSHEGQEERDSSEDLSSIQVEVLEKHEKGNCCDGPVTVSFKAKRGVHLQQHRFKCYVYTEDYYPMCNSETEAEIRRGRDNTMKMEIPCQKIWLPGRYLLLVLDTADGKVRKTCFALNDRLETVDVSGSPVCDTFGLEDVVVNLIQSVDEEWDEVAEMPGMRQFRQRVMQARRLLLYNEVRKDEMGGEVKVCQNLLICTRNNDISAAILDLFQSMMDFGYALNYIDCSTLFDLTLSNPYEQLPERIGQSGKSVICLDHLSELTGSSGKVILKKIVEQVDGAHGDRLLWLCGSRREIDELFSLYPSLRKYFWTDSYVEQESYTGFELVQAFFRQLNKESLKPDAMVKNLLSRTILMGSRQGVLADWSLDDVRRYIAEEVIPRYLDRTQPIISLNHGPLLEMEDFDFAKLTNKASAFEESMNELNGMIGLAEVKQGILSTANQVRLSQERRRLGLKASSSMALHAIFTGNPGTGKTTVARQLGHIYHAMGLLSKGEVIAVDRANLVGQYIGQTEENMKVILEEAKGNVLFIDEAYTLVTNRDDKKDFGGRVLDSLLTVLTQPDPDMLIVFAGYTKEMDVMLSTNPGLAGRFPYRYQFADYTEEQLMEIARRLIARDEFILSDEADKAMQDAIAQMLAQRLPNFSNARWIEQFVKNGIIPAMADRVFSTDCSDVQRIEASDVQKAFEKFSPKAIELKPRHRVKGFSA